MQRDRVHELRRYLRDEENGPEIESDQSRGRPAPPMMLMSSGAPLIQLPRPEECPVAGRAMLDAVNLRRSRRTYNDQPLTLLQISYMLYVCQGYQCPRPGQQSYAAFRTVPSAGCRHPLDTYLAVRSVEGVPAGVYRFLPREHALELARAYDPEELRAQVTAAANGQRFCGDASVCVFWAADMYRSEWRYPLTAHKVVLLDAGHACQNLYWACEALQLGTCAVASYNQKKCDALLGVDGEDVFTIYLAPVGAPR